jgi:hypothetical protein
MDRVIYKHETGWVLGRYEGGWFVAHERKVNRGKTKGQLRLVSQTFHGTLTTAVFRLVDELSGQQSHQSLLDLLKEHREALQDAIGRLERINL